MTQEVYTKLKSIATAYIFKGRNYYPSEITSDDLLSETLIYMSEKQVPINIVSFRKCIVKARSNMVKAILNEQPKIRAQHHHHVHNYYHKNGGREKAKEYIEKEKATLSDKYIMMSLSPTGLSRKEMTKEMIEAKRNRIIARGVDQSARAHGIHHGKFNGMIVTPHGRFETYGAAAKSHGISSGGIVRRIESKNFPEYYKEQNH